MKPAALFLSLFAALCARVPSVLAAPSEYPAIIRLSPRDVVFMQVQDSIAQGYRAELAAGPLPDLFVCRWTAIGGEDLLSVAARLSVPYETLATLNGMVKPRPFAAGEVVLIPSIAGVFVPDVPRTDLDVIMSARPTVASQHSQRISIVVAGVERQYTFYPGARLNPTERSFFLEIGFRMPLPQSIMTSAYGFRRSPIDGHDRLHEGIDLAAPFGTAVLAARDGTVISVGDDPILGLNVVIDHEVGMRTLYGHLSSIAVVLNQTIRSGTMIGSVGSTGLSTGPHLHFEIRLSGKTRDPSSYLPGLKQ